MGSEVITGEAALGNALAELFAWAEHVDMAVAWANSAGGEAQHWRSIDIKKIRRAAIGIAFAGTEPAALRALHEGADRLRIVQKQRGTFHPKVVLARCGREWRAIVGSANLTAGAYTANTELCVLLYGTESDPQYRALEGFVRQQWRGGVRLDPKWLPAYEKSFKRAQRKRQEVKVPLLQANSPALLTLAMTWDEYVEKINEQDDRLLVNGYSIRVAEGDRSYFSELDKAAKFFRKRGGFESLSPEERTFLMGKGNSSGLLGSMGGAGKAMHIAQKKPKEMAAIDTLPRSGVPTLDEVRRLLKALTKPKGIGLGVATRLMAAKRPDLFVSVNRGSEPQLAEARRGKGIKSINQYLDFLQEVWSTDWYLSDRPSDSDEAALWDRRAALLDAALYQYVPPR